MRGQFFFKRAFGQWHVAALAVFLAKHEAFTSEKPLSFGGIVDHCGLLLTQGMSAYAGLTRGLRGAYADASCQNEPLSNFMFCQILKVNLKN